MKGKKALLNFLKIFGICFGAILGLIALVVLYITITGGFNEKHVEITGLQFEQEIYEISDDSEIMLLPMPEDATELNVNIRIIKGSDIIEIEQDENTTFKIGEKITVKVKKIETAGETPKFANVGGWAEVRAEQGLYTTTCKIFVDVPVEEFTIKTDRENEDYNVFPDESFNVMLDSVYPTNSLNPTMVAGVSGEFAKSDKTLVYESSDRNLATVDSSGKVTVLNGVSGSFTINAYVITTYDNLNHIPNSDDYETTQEYIDAFNKIRVFATSSLTFNIKQISVNNIQSTKVNKEFNMFDSVRLTSDDFNLVLNPETGSSYTSSDLDYMLPNIQAYAGYFVNNVSGISDYITINNKNIVLSEEFIKITKINAEKPTWQLDFVEFKSGFEANCIYFKLVTEVDDNDNEIKCVENYSPITILKQSVDSLIINLPNGENKINLSLQNNTDYQTDTYNISDNYTLLPNNSTYKKVLFFTDENQSVIESDENNIICSTRNIESQGDEPGGTNKVYGLIVPKSVGSVTIWACVVRTDIDGNILTDSLGNLQIITEYTSSNTIIVNVSQELILNKADIVDSSENKLDTNVYYNNDSTKDVVSTTLAIGQQAKLTLDENNVEALVSAYTLQRISFISSNNSTFQINPQIKDGKLHISLAGITEGEAALQVYLDEVLKFNITITVISDKVVGLTLSANNNNVTVLIDGSTYSWKTVDGNDFALNVGYNPSSTEVKGVIFSTFSVPTGYEENPAGEFEFAEDSSVLEITNDVTGDLDLALFNFKKAGKVLVMATSLDARAGTIVSNKILINVVTPEINIEFLYDDNLTLDEVVSVKNTSISLINKTDEHGVSEGKKFIAKTYNLDGSLSENVLDNALFNFHFKTGEIINTLGYLQSSRSGAFIDNVNKNITFANINVTIVEQIEISTTFGFVCNVTYDYRLLPDYKSSITYNNESQINEYYSFSEIDIFAAMVDENPLITFTNFDGTKNYYPIGYHNELAGEDTSNDILSISFSNSLLATFVELDRELDSSTARPYIKFRNVMEKTSLSIYIYHEESNYMLIYNVNILPIAQFNFTYENVEIDRYGNTSSNFDLADAINGIKLNEYISLEAVEGKEILINECTITNIEFYSFNAELRLDNNTLYLADTRVAEITNNNGEFTLISYDVDITLNLKLFINGTITMEDGDEQTCVGYYLLNILA